MARLKKTLMSIWAYLREASGENDYTLYRARALADGGSAMSPEEFYLWQLHQKYSRINRCC